ncbi:thiol reductant ABC exporter subunit CydD [Frigoribacterium sp. CFBP 13707]|uniref:thiol reductant ABC exporter subunit CydD n=1 Tax=Frigoribacterium sp. CFBP 13707 TaxID=2775313 RepID=UPI00177B30EA|nr:thiol reductant ABC exporter subunit CydD [Frigoribacterium sp. CFBP 13707]
MKPLDPRLLRYASAARAFLVLGAVLGVLQTMSVVGVAWGATRAVVSVVEGTGAGATGEALVVLAVSVVARSATSWALEAVAARTAATVKSQLRARVLAAVSARGREWVAERGSARLTTLVGPGLDALDEYFSRYLPQLVLTALATPLIVGVMLVGDWLSAVIVLVTLPLIPLFMVLIGWTTRAAQDRQWERLQALAASFLDAVEGLSTLKVFGRERRQVERIGRLTDDHRRHTMAVLRVSFLSGFALELAASLSVALVAVSVGIRLVDGSLALSVGLFVLLLAPEAFLPLRQVGAAFHAASDGVAAAEGVFAVLEEGPAGGRASSAGPTPARAAVAPVGAGDALVVSAVSVERGGVVSLAPTSFVAETGRVTAVTGPSGVGKSTLLAAVRGEAPHGGEVRWRDADRGCVVGDVAWSGQRPGLVSGTVAENVALGDEVDPPAVAAALRAAGAPDVDPGLVLGAGGGGLSGGQAQRVALARALYRVERRGARLLLVDEPSSALDAVTEAAVVAGLRRAAARGVAVVVVTHRAALRESADDVVVLAPATAQATASEELLA